MKAKKAIRAIISIFLVLITLLSTFIPAVAAAENGIVEDFKVEFISGADNVDGKYVFDATKDNSGLRWNRFIYRVNYALSGEGMLQPGKVKITLPTSIITDRDGNIADEFDIAVPHADDVEETDNEVKFVYTVENDNTIVITNRLEISSAQAGNIEIAYIPTKSEINYVDMKKSADVTSTFTLGEGGAGYTRTSTADGVYFDTSAVNQSTEVKLANFSLNWNSAWGLPKPENDDQYCYIVWSVKTSLSNATQYYDFQINNNVITDNGEAIGYKFQNQTKYVSENHIEHQNSYNTYSDYIKYRYDYVLTKHLKSEVLVNECKITDNIETVVIPYDRVDESTKSSGSDTYVYYNIQRLDNIGRIFTNKYGLYNVKDGEGSIVKDSNYISDGRLEEFRNGDINAIDKLRYLVDYGANGWNWKVLRTSTTIDSVEGFPSTYIVQDDTLKLNNNQTALEKDDYDFTALKIKSANYDISVVNNTTINYDTTKPKNDINFDVYVSVNGKDNYVKVATYHQQNHTWSNVNNDIVTSTQADGQIFFKPGVDAWKVQTTTDAFHVGISIYPEISLFRTERVLNQLGELAVVPLTNQADFVIRYNEFGAQEISERASSSSSNDYLADLSAVKKSYLLITPDSSKNNRIKKQYEASWTVNMHESIAKTGNVEQKSGRFYILLPIGATLENDSVSVTNGNGDKILPGQFRYDTIPNYKDSGRTMLVVDIDKTGENYYVHYNTIHSWANIKDYGAMTYTSAAYETGNKKIYNGFPDNGDSLTDSNYMNDLDSETDDEKFIYSSRYFNIVAVTTSSTGLTKFVQSKDDEKPVQSTLVHQNETYAYHIRIANDYKTRSKNIILFDSLENFSKENLISNWKGTLQSVDTSNLTDKGVNAVVYYSSIENLDVSEHYDLTEKISGDKVWKTAEEFGNISNAKAIAIDCRKTVDGDNFVLDRNQSINIPVYLKSPNQVPDLVDDPETYNNIYLNQTLIVENGLEVNDFIHYDYTAVGFRTVGDIEIRKVDSTDHSKTIEGVVFNLVGRSDYGTEYNLTSTTDQNGYICFNDVEKGNYTITEIEGVIDYQEDHNSIAVSIDSNGNVTVEDKEKEGNIYIIENKPRIHGDLTFTKVDKISYETGDKKLEGAEFRLSGKSDYGNDILMYATSNTEGQVNFYNIELGTYTLVETKYPDNYRNDGKKYTVVCDNSGILSIDVPLNSKGKYEIENEPYEEIKVYKVDADNPSLYLEGVQLRIHGTSDYGTEYDRTIETNSNGVASFGEMEVGKYILEEVQALENYKLDESKYVVTISANHIITIEGLKKNNLGFWVFPNQRELNGKIKVTKVWKDNADNETRQTPKVHIGLREMEKNVPTATFSRGLWQNYFSFSMKSKALSFSNCNNKLKEEVLAISGVTKVDDNTTSKSIYFWAETDENDSSKCHIYWWSDAAIVYLPSDSSSLFDSSKFVNIDLSGINTSKVINMHDMFAYCYSLATLDVSSFDTSNVTDMNSMFSYCQSLTTLDISNFDTSNVTDMSYMFLNCWAVTWLDVSNFDTNNVRNMRKMFQNCQTIISLDLIDFDTHSVTNMSYMFAGCRKLISLDLSNFDTSKITDMNYMFYDCQSLTSLDLSNFDTSKVTDMSFMFHSCSSLTALDVSSFDTSKVTNMGSMFSYCNKLTALDVSGFDTSKVTNMSQMFESCSTLTTLDLSNFDTSKVTNMSRMFYQCSAITALDLSNFDTSKVTDTWQMFQLCVELSSVDLSGFDTSKVTDMSGMFYICDKLKTIYASNLFDTNAVVSSTDMFIYCPVLKGGNGTVYDRQKTNKEYARIDTAETPGYFTYKEATQTEPTTPAEPVVKPPVAAEYATLSKSLLTETFDLSSSPYYWGRAYISSFTRDTEKTLEEVKAINGVVKVDDNATDKVIYIWASNYVSGARKDVYWWTNASTVYLPTNSSYLFANLNGIQSVDLTGFNASKVTIADSMFSGCSSLETVDISNWNTSKLTSAADMFSDCYALTTPGVSSLKTNKLTNISGMFSGCGALSSLDLNGWNTKKLENINSTFSNCTNLSNLGIGNWNTQSLTDMESAFGNCSKLNPINIGSWDVSKVTNLRETFNYCRAITSLDVSDWNTSSVTDMQGTFKGASSLTSLDLSGWDTSSVTNMREMFSGDTSLTTVYVSDLFNTDAVTDFNGMFYNAKNIVGGKGTTYDSSKINGEYANIDRTDDAGYLTLKDVLSRTYDSDDNGWTIVDDNTWTYTFDVFDDTAQYYIYEEDMEGYKSDTSYEAKKRLNDGDITNVITITNTADDVPDEPDKPPITDFGSLTVTKTVHGDGLAVGEQGYIIGDFTFKLTLSGNDDITSGTKVWGDRVYENGVTTFKLHDRQSASFTGIPAGLNYTVTELNTEGYTVLTENASGTITKDVNAAVSFVNNWQGDSRNKNSFSLVKRVINGEDNDVFNFTVFLTNLYPKLAYKLSDNTVYYSDSDGEATVNVQLKADDVITFQNLPVGSTYQITEKATPYYASYSVADELNLKMITSSSGSNTEVNKALSTGKENVEDNEKITVTFTNEKIITPVEPDPPAVKSVSVIKNWVNDNPTERPDSITVYLYQNEDLLKSAEITSADNWRTTFDNLLVYDDFGKEYEYSVIEADVRGYVTDYTSSGNTYTITNTKVPVGNIEISNEIRGNAADFTKEFKYTVTLTDANGEPVTASFERIGTKAGDMPFVNGVSTIYLTHHDDITIKDIPAGYHFKIVQTEDALYTVTPDTATYEGVIIANDTIRNPYINELNAYGTLMVRKELESTRTEDRNLEFDFTVSIVKGNEKLSGTYECEGTSLSSITFNDGSANFKLKGGQTISIKDLPVGADYEVEEVGANSLDFLTYADNQKGVISKNSEENLVRFKNVRNVLPETGSYGNILLIGGSAFFLLLGFTVLLLRKREKNETK